jgi:hypothetical protein
LHVNFGHFGGLGAGGQDFLKRLTRAPGSPGASAFVDASYFSALLDDEPTLRRELSAVLATDAAGASILPERLLYGSDWKMLALEENAGGYLASFQRLIEKLSGSVVNPPGGRRFADGFFGANAAAFLGLRKDEQTRRRLERFYAASGLRDRPEWMAKVDALG